MTPSGPPALNELYANAVQLEFDVSATGSVMNARVGHWSFPSRFRPQGVPPG